MIQYKINKINPIIYICILYVINYYNLLKNYFWKLIIITIFACLINDNQSCKIKK